MKPTPTCLQRLTKEYRLIRKDPIPNVHIRPSPVNILQWYFVIPGPKDTPLERGKFFGGIRFDPDYPFKPPGVTMITPTGVFATGEICIEGITNFHPESWIPTIGPGTIILSLQSFFYDQYKSALAHQTRKQKDEWVKLMERYSRASYVFNLKESMFLAMFPELVNEFKSCIQEIYLKQPDETAHDSDGDRDGVVDQKDHQEDINELTDGIAPAKENDDSEEHHSNDIDQSQTDNLPEQPRLRRQQQQQQQPQPQPHDPTALNQVDPAHPISSPDPSNPPQDPSPHHPSPSPPPTTQGMTKHTKKPLTKPPKRSTPISSISDLFTSDELQIINKDINTLPFRDRYRIPCSPYLVVVIAPLLIIVSAVLSLFLRAL